MGGWMAGEIETNATSAQPGLGLGRAWQKADGFWKKTRPSSDSEAATMYKLKGQSSNMQTGQSFENRELVRLADLSS